MTDMRAVPTLFIFTLACTFGYSTVLATQDCNAAYPPFTEWDSRVRGFSIALGLQNWPVAITRPPFEGAANVELKCLSGLLNHAFVLGLVFGIVNAILFWIVSVSGRASGARYIISRFSTSTSPASHEKLLWWFGIATMLFGLGVAWVWIEGGPRDALLGGSDSMLALQTFGLTFAGLSFIGGIRVFQAAIEMDVPEPPSAD